MKLSVLLALTLPLVASCGDDVDAAADDARNAGENAVDGLSNVTLDDIRNNLSVDRIQEHAKEGMDRLAEGLRNIEDVADVEALKQKMGPMLDKLRAMKDQLGASLPNSEQVQSAISSVTSKFDADGEIMQALQPFIDKVQSLFS